MNSVKVVGLAAAVAMLNGVAAAQLVPMDYSTNWAPMGTAPAVAFSGAGLFSPISGEAHDAQPGDALRRCYGYDTTQGGRNQSAGRWENTWFKIAQGYAAANGTPGVDVGLLSVQAGSDSDVGGDACFSPFFQSVGNTGGHQLGAAAVLGLQTGTAGAAFPSVWEIAFAWLGSGAGFQGVFGNSTIGNDAPIAGCALGNRLLVNVVYEVQGPLNGGPADRQYYLGSTTEVEGLAASGSGGVSNGNNAMGSTLFGVPAETSNAVSHTRLFAIAPTAGTITGSTNYFIVQPGDFELSGHIAFQTPFLWATNNGNDGGGGSDWVVGAAPVSTVDVRSLDNLAGGTTNPNKNAKFGGPPAGPAAANDPSIVFNQSIMLWSASFAVNQQEQATSWDDLGGAPICAIAGSIVLGAQGTSREGAQTVPIVFDALTASILNVGGLTLGKKYTASEDVFLDGVVGPGGANSQIWEGMFDPVVSGISTLTLGAFPVVAAPQPALVGNRLGLCCIGLQVDTTPAVALLLTEFNSSLQIDLQ